MVKIRKARLRFTDARIISDSERLAQLRQARAGIDPVVWPVDYDAFTEQIQLRERSIERLTHRRATLMEDF